MCQKNTPTPRGAGIVDPMPLHLRSLVLTRLTGTTLPTTAVTFSSRALAKDALETIETSLSPYFLGLSCSSLLFVFT